MFYNINDIWIPSVRNIFYCFWANYMLNSIDETPVLIWIEIGQTFGLLKICMIPVLCSYAGVESLSALSWSLASLALSLGFCADDQRRSSLRLTQFPLARRSAWAICGAVASV